MTDKTKPPAIVRGPGDDSTIIHFGIDVAKGPGESVVGIVQESQIVLVGRGEWPEVKKQIDEYFEGLK